ncbi:LOW QUALITY PROTEIN: uncharacterized protein LOC110812694 [Carica papaya]|uniref:LOW QUALITY PROTEIN: uncharacterized protein LOC110812694 n=1 Tax=Carica papaya TaxID=3649 RepID=UPI000B8CFE24|nr:LOW QUALITY PROTEIN: uncharacterized protein LOC110812694 [Carica papaya]
MWDSIYDSFQEIGQDKLANANSKYEIIDVEPSERAPRCVRVEEIIDRIATYFERDHDIWNGKTFNQLTFRLLRKLSYCGFWLAEQFCVKDFKSLGHGDFFNFLEKHVLLLPSNLHKLLAGEASEKFPLEVCMLEQMLIVLVSQASDNLLDNEVVTEQILSALLMRQFPSVNFKIVENDSLENFLEIVKKSKNNVFSNSILFSIPLLGSQDLLDCDDSLAFSATKLENGEGTRTSKSISSKDAVEVLLRAPLLSDLNVWSHWDSVFAPSLGPLVGWLLNEVNIKQLLCLVTKDGKVIRIDPSATIDSFLTAVLQGSAYQTAVQLLSLYALSGGKKYVPLALLKCQARQAFEVTLNNCKEKIEVLPLCRQNVVNEVSTDNVISGERHSIKRNEAVSITSRFVLDCLVHIPLEFCSFAADVLLSGLRSVVKDAPLVILSECNLLEQRVMLHEVGLTLGIGEWIDDYVAFRSAVNANMLLYSGSPSFKDGWSHLSSCSNHDKKEVDTVSNSEGKLIASEDTHECTEVSHMIDRAKAVDDCIHSPGMLMISETHAHRDADLIIESIRRDEFGLDSNLSESESSMLKKQHARLGRALHCLSHELYSQDSHFLLELVQNADDNVYKKSVEPTLVFILQESGIVILNNEEGFSAENIRALCDVGKSTKKGSGGYIGQKGIGFKSVFRVSDAPEIHSNGFHVKFDISEGQIGFVLPTVVPSCNIDIYSKILSQHASQLGQQGWNTCIILPFKSKFSGGVSMNNINAMFSDLHPSLLLFLHRLQCIVFQNLIEDSLIIMKKEVLENGIIKVSSGKDRMTWLVESQKLHVEKNRPDVQTTEIAIAFTLQESDNGKYKPYLSQQPVFSYLPLRTYGLKFILQGDFVLPSSREEVDGDSPWNQWLLLKFPDLFIRAEKSFCALPCFMENPGKGVGAYMSFVPLVGEVHGFFSSLPRIIISKLRVSNCLLMEGDKKQWVPPCKVLRGWNEQARALLTDSLLHEHLGLGLLNKDIVLTDYLSRALGIEDYGPKILVEIIASLSRTKNDLKSIGLGWLASCLNELYTLSFHSTRQASLNLGKEEDLIDRLRNIPFIPLSDGAYGSLIEDTIWLHSDGSEFDGGHGLEAFPKLYAKLRIVNPVFLFASDVDITCRDVNLAGNLIRMLCRIGVQNLSAHEIMKVHILPAVSDEGNRNIDKSLMIEYLCFVMMHLDSGCPDCRSQKEHIFRELKDKTFILTNYGFKKTTETPIHFGEEFGNCINVYKLIDEADMKWHEVSMDYLKHPASKAHAYGVKKWREFFQEIGVTDFVQVVQVDKSVVNLSSTDLKIIKGDMNLISPGLVVKDWESLELVQLLSSLSQRGNKEGCKYLLEVLDMLWHDCFSDKTTIDCNSLSVCGDRLINSSFVCNIRDICWVVSSMDDKLHCAKDLFYDCDEVRSILGTAAPYAVPKVRNEKLINAAGFKTKVTIDDILEIQDIWRMSPTPFRASISQMTRFYRFIWNEISTSKQRIIEKFHSSPSIFVPCESGIRHEDVVSGVFLSVGEVCWHDSTGSINQLKEIHRQCGLIAEPLCSKTLCDVYPGFHDFFVKECSVLEMPSFRGYLRIVLELSRNTLPSCAASSVFRVFLKWADGLKSGQCSEDILYLKDCLTKLEFTVLPTEQDKWVSLHHSFGLVCWSDDEKLKKIFRRKDNIDFLNFGKLSDEEQEVLQSKILDLMHALDIPVLSEVVTREAIYEGRTDSCFKMSLVNWALPYAQRYFYTLHPDKYLKLKQSGFNNLNQLQIVAVEKLYYRNIINRCGAASRKQVECNCLLQVSSGACFSFLFVFLIYSTYG